MEGGVGERMGTRMETRMGGEESGENGKEGSRGRLARGIERDRRTSSLLSSVRAYVGKKVSQSLFFQHMKTNGLHSHYLI